MKEISLPFLKALLRNFNYLLQFISLLKSINEHAIILIVVCLSTEIFKK